MKLIEHAGKQRPKTIKVELVPNYGGQGGNDYIVLQANRNGNRYWLLVPETEDDVKELMRQAHVLHHNFKFSETDVRRKAKVAGG